MKSRSYFIILATFVLLGWALLTQPVMTLRADGVSVTTKAVSNLRGGPATTYPKLASIPAKTNLPAIGRTADNAWVQVNFNETIGWLAVKLVTVNGDLNSLPTVDAPAPAVEPTKAPAANVRAGKEFATSAGGVLRVSKVEVAKIWPPHCVTNCTTPVDGYTLLVLSFAPKSKLSYDDAYAQMASEWQQAQVLTAEGFATGPSILTYTSGVIDGRNQTKLQLIFGVPTATRKFSFTWPNNAPIPLRR